MVGLNLVKIVTKLRIQIVISIILGLFSSFLIYSLFSWPQGLEKTDNTILLLFLTSFACWLIQIWAGLLVAKTVAENKYVKGALGAVIVSIVSGIIISISSFFYMLPLVADLLGTTSVAAMYAAFLVVWLILSVLGAAILGIVGAFIAEKVFKN